MNRGALDKQHESVCLNLAVSDKLITRTASFQQLRISPL